MATPTQQCDDTAGADRVVQMHGSLGSLPCCASLAQWQSSGLLIHWFWVRIPGEALRLPGVMRSFGALHRRRLTSASDILGALVGGPTTKLLHSYTLAAEFRLAGNG